MAESERKVGSSAVILASIARRAKGQKENVNETGEESEGDV